MRETVYVEAVIEASGRHIHLSERDAKALLGENFRLTCKKKLGEAGEFLSDSKLLIEGKDGKTAQASVLGPYRRETQVELSYTEARAIGMTPVLGDSGQLDGTTPVTLIGPEGTLHLERGAMVARRHVHMPPADAEKLGVGDRDIVSLRIEGARAVIFENVLVRVAPAEIGSTYSNVHLDYDEWNAAGLSGGCAKGLLYRDEEDRA